MRVEACRCVSKRGVSRGCFDTHPTRHFNSCVNARACASVAGAGGDMQPDTRGLCRLSAAS
eukprot:3252516-Pleurochrysis_carterae.AAC.1